jgi:hypothetical protein
LPEGTVKWFSNEKGYGFIARKRRRRRLRPLLGHPERRATRPSTRARPSSSRSPTAPRARRPRTCGRLRKEQEQDGAFGSLTSGITQGSQGPAPVRAGPFACPAVSPGPGTHSPLGGRRMPESSGSVAAAGRLPPRPGGPRRGRPPRRRPCAGWPGRCAGWARGRRGGPRWPPAGRRARPPAAGPTPGRGSGMLLGGEAEADLGHGDQRHGGLGHHLTRGHRGQLLAQLLRAGQGSGPAPTSGSSAASTAGTIDATVALIRSGPRTSGPSTAYRTKQKRGLLTSGPQSPRG